MKKLVFALLAAGLVSASVFGQTKRQDIIDLLDITKAKEQAMQMFDLLMPNLQAMAPSAPASFWRTFRNRIDADSYVALLIPIYDRNFSHDDIKNLIAFYKSPIGKKLLEVTPKIIQESYTIGAEWGENLARDVINELKRSGYYSDTLPDSTSEYMGARPQYATFSLIGQISVRTKDQIHVVVVDMLLEYDLNNNAAQTELTGRVNQLRDFTRNYFAGKHYSELEPGNEARLKQEIREILNTRYLDTAKVRGILFNKLDVMEL